jgi:hypothetical protein
MTKTLISRPRRYVWNWLRYERLSHKIPSVTLYGMDSGENTGGKSERKLPRLNLGYTLAIIKLALNLN